MKLDIEKLEIKIKEFRLGCENLSLQQGEIFQMAAPNGSGKSMFLKGLTGLVKTQRRSIKINGNDIDKLNLSDFVGAYLGEEFLIPFYEPQEYFELIGKIKGLEKSQIKLIIESHNDLFKQKWPNKYIRELSTGMRKKVGLAASLIGQPQIILWDEPFENIDDDGHKYLNEFLKAEKRLIVYTSPVSGDQYSTGTLIIQAGMVLKNSVS
jgi:ABC-2 type transport system ATP-binding protein